MDYYHSNTGSGGDNSARNVPSDETPWRGIETGREHQGGTGYFRGTPTKFPDRYSEGNTVNIVPDTAGGFQEKKHNQIENLLDEYPELYALKKLECLTVLLSVPDFDRRSELAGLAELALLSKIRGLESLSELEKLRKFSPISGSYYRNKS